MALEITFTDNHAVCWSVDSEGVRTVEHLIEIGILKNIDTAETGADLGWTAYSDSS